MAEPRAARTALPAIDLGGQQAPRTTVLADPVDAGGGTRAAGAAEATALNVYSASQQPAPALLALTMHQRAAAVECCTGCVLAALQRAARAPCAHGGTRGVRTQGPLLVLAGARALQTYIVPELREAAAPTQDIDVHVHTEDDAVFDAVCDDVEARCKVAVEEVGIGSGNLVCFRRSRIVQLLTTSGETTMMMRQFSVDVGAPNPVRAVDMLQMTSELHAAMMDCRNAPSEPRGGSLSCRARGVGAGPGPHLTVVTGPRAPERGGEPGGREGGGGDGKGEVAWEVAVQPLWELCVGLWRTVDDPLCYRRKKDETRRRMLLFLAQSGFLAARPIDVPAPFVASTGPVGVALDRDAAGVAPLPPAQRAPSWMLARPGEARAGAWRAQNLLRAVRRAAGEAESRATSRCEAACRRALQGMQRSYRAASSAARVAEVSLERARRAERARDAAVRDLRSVRARMAQLERRCASAERRAAEQAQAAARERKRAADAEASLRDLRRSTGRTRDAAGRFRRCASRALRAHDELMCKTREAVREDTERAAKCVDAYSKMRKALGTAGNLITGVRVAVDGACAEAARHLVLQNGPGCDGGGCPEREPGEASGDKARRIYSSVAARMAKEGCSIILAADSHAAANTNNLGDYLGAVVAYVVSVVVAAAPRESRQERREDGGVGSPEELAMLGRARMAAGVRNIRAGDASAAACARQGEEAAGGAPEAAPPAAAPGKIWRMFARGGKWHWCAVPASASLATSNPARVSPSDRDEGRHWERVCVPFGTHGDQARAAWRTLCAFLMAPLLQALDDARESLKTATEAMHESLSTCEAVVRNVLSETKLAEETLEIHSFARILDAPLGYATWPTWGPSLLRHLMGDADALPQWWRETGKKRIDDPSAPAGDPPATEGEMLRRALQVHDGAAGTSSAPVKPAADRAATFGRCARCEAENAQRDVDEETLSHADEVTLEILRALTLPPLKDDTEGAMAALVSRAAAEYRKKGIARGVPAWALPSPAAGKRAAEEDGSGAGVVSTPFLDKLCGLYSGGERRAEASAHAGGRASPSALSDLSGESRAAVKSDGDGEQDRDRWSSAASDSASLASSRKSGVRGRGHAHAKHGGAKGGGGGGKSKKKRKSGR